MSELKKSFEARHGDLKVRVGLGDKVVILCFCTNTCVESICHKFEGEKTAKYCYDLAKVLFSMLGFIIREVEL